MTPGAKYRVSIRTVNTGQIESDWSQIDLATKSDKPDAPTDISVTAVQSQLVAIEWKEPKRNGSPITGYEIEGTRGLHFDFFEILFKSFFDFEMISNW